jgi:hypothetical protein
MRLLIAALVFVIACGGSAQPIHNLPLGWRGVSATPRASASVEYSLRAVPFSFGVRDTRPDPYFVGTHEDIGHVVRTSDNVAQYCSSRIGDMLIAALSNALASATEKLIKDDAFGRALAATAQAPSAAR